jgi:hypothetical protein
MTKPKKKKKSPKPVEEEPARNLDEIMRALLKVPPKKRKKG